MQMMGVSQEKEQNGRVLGEDLEIQEKPGKDLSVGR